MGYLPALVRRLASKFFEPSETFEPSEPFEPVQVSVLVSPCLS
jgi:hypothetical protein